jgi:ribosomal protein S14
MKYLERKDKKKRLKFVDKELQFLKFKFLFLQNNLNFKFHKELFNEFLSFNKNFFFVKIVNRCIKTKKVGSILRNFKISRIEFRRLSSNGQINGVTKSSW